jgi:uncharacterized protein (TIGR02246 family)
MNTSEIPVALGVVASVLFLVPSGESVQQAVADEALTHVRAQVEAYEDAWNSHDAAAVAAFFTHDADMVMGNGPRIEGREAIAEWWARYFSAISGNRAGTIELESLRLLGPHVALANVNTLTAGRSGNEEELPARRARGTWILTVQDGQWLISALRGLPAEGDSRVTPGRDR